MELNTISATRVEEWVLDACNVVSATAASSDHDFDTPLALLQCVLGSRVRHEVAVANTQAVWGRVASIWQSTSRSELEDLVHSVLRRPPSGASRYPFPRRGAALAAGALIWLRGFDPPLTLSDLCQLPPRAARRSLLDCPGLGPKQASLFLRSLRPSARLAVLDSRVLTYLSHRLPSLVTPTYPRSLPHYESIEDHYLDYADWLGQQPAVLDLAIWYVSKAMSELAL